MVVRSTLEPALKQKVGEPLEQVLDVDGVQDAAAVLRVGGEPHEGHPSAAAAKVRRRKASGSTSRAGALTAGWRNAVRRALLEDRKSTRLNSSHVKISYAVFCLKKKTTE